MVKNLTLEQSGEITRGTAAGILLILSSCLVGCATNPASARATSAEGGTAELLLGHWQGEVLTSGEERDRTLYITSVQQENGRWTASGLFGRTGERLFSFTNDVRADGAHPQLTIAARSGTRFELTLDGPTYIEGQGYPATGRRPFFVGLERVDARGVSPASLAEQLTVLEGEWSGQWGDVGALGGYSPFGVVARFRISRVAPRVRASFYTITGFGENWTWSAWGYATEGGKVVLFTRSGRIDRLTLSRNGHGWNLVGRYEGVNVPAMKSGPISLVKTGASEHRQTVDEMPDDHLPLPEGLLGGSGR
jgi:hypothetical protein